MELPTVSRPMNDATNTESPLDLYLDLLNGANILC